MYHRRKILLNLVAAFGDRGVQKIKLQKLLFLFCQKQEQAAFDFVPYKYGCFSFQAAKDINVLATHYRLLREKENTWIVGSEEIPALSASEQQQMTDLIMKFKDHDDAKMVDYVYSRHPYFSISSEWRMTPKQKQDRQEQQENINQQNGEVLFTIGYEGRSIDGYLNLLIENNIKLLCDVRKNPISMKYGFSKNQLDKYCKSLGIAYEHIPELGIPSDKRRQLGTSADYQALFAEYSEALPLRETALDQVLELLRKHKRIALTCFERGHRDCHRHCISEYLGDGRKVEAKHL